MLVQALAAYADTYLAEELDAFEFEHKPVPFLLVLDVDGRFLAVEQTEVVEERRDGKGKSRRHIPSLMVPRSPVSRTSKIAPLLGVDAIQYVVGAGPWTPVGKEVNHRERQNAFVQLMLEVANATEDAGARAAARFLNDVGELEKARADLAEAKAAEGALVAIALREVTDGRIRPREPIIARPALRAWWRQHFASSMEAKDTDAPEATCLISGRRSRIAATHPPIKGASSLGGQPSGVALMSFDKLAFRSYGWEQNENAPVSQERANAYVLAINDLMRPGEHRLGASPDVRLRTRFDLGDAAFLYWTDVPVDIDPLMNVVDPEAHEERVLALAEGAELASAAFAAPYRRTRGVVPEDVKFHLAVVSANGARLVVRRWLSQSLADVTRCVGTWYRDLAIADVFAKGNAAGPPRLLDLARALVPDRGEKTLEQLKGGEMTALVTRALAAEPLGLSFLSAAVRQCQRADGTKRLAPARAGFIRLLTNDCIRLFNEGGPLMPATLADEITHPAYVCGRLFAELENLQRVANDQQDVNATITDRYFSGACRNPREALPRLLELKEAHLRKLRRSNRPAFVAISKRIDGLVSTFRGPPPEFPGLLSIIDQGRFIIGYHHHRAAAAMEAAKRKADREAESKEN